MNYRHEYKFTVSELDLVKIRYRLEPLMRLDDHHADDFYTIRSLYFDDYFDTCLSENEAGVDNRHKYRIRLYDGELDYIRLERKDKLRGMTGKTMEPITPEEIYPYIEGTNEAMGTELRDELYMLQVKKGMRPKCIVEYDRLAFIEDVGNVRITFDMNVRGSQQVDRFLDFSEDFMVPAMDPGLHVLEVKYDEVLPTYLLQALDLGYLHRQSVSKYGVVRNAIKEGGLY